ncbi:protein-glutamate O-methyltransferase CheR [Duganella hordei]|uniref:protein-glutamate O-methyltransferase CheR n=1 Tax=Duganella hordei TaxID=2865934 RepID=UPI0030E92880
MLIDRHAEPTAAAAADALLARFSGYVAEHLGLHFPRGLWPELLRAAEALARDSGIAGIAGTSRAAVCMERLMAAAPTRAGVEQLARHLTIGETYFFREPELFDTLERDVLPPLIAARRAAGKTLRVWSAGCCTGEELYSLAILLHRLIPDLADWRVTLLGTDINPQFLRKAEQGVYRDWSFRNVPDWIRRCYFDGGTIAPVLRQGVRFDYLNLATGAFPGPDSGTPPMDLILCRNVLMYFAPACAARTVLRLRDALAGDGWLAVGVAETGHSLLKPLQPVRFGAAQLYRRPTPAAAPPPPPLSAAPAPAAVTVSPPPRARMPDLAERARQCADRGLLAAAGDCCAAAIARDKCDPGLRYLQALILEEQGDVAAAMGALRDALYLDQTFVLAHFTLGTLCRRNGDEREAARHFANALELLHGRAPDEPLAHAGGLRAGELADLMRAGAGTH